MIPYIVSCRTPKNREDKTQGVPRIECTRREKRKCLGKKAEKTS